MKLILSCNREPVWNDFPKMNRDKAEMKWVWRTKYCKELKKITMSFNCFFFSLKNWGVFFLKTTLNLEASPVCLWFLLSLFNLFNQPNGSASATLIIIELQFWSLYKGWWYWELQLDWEVAVLLRSKEEQEHVKQLLRCRQWLCT